jgi:nucleoid-associated protein YgaU
MLAPGIAAWPACDTQARDGGALSAGELKSAAVVVPMTPPVMPQRAEPTASATTPKQLALGAVPPPSSQSTTTYSVRVGDCLSDIATSHNIADWPQLYALNRRGISKPNLIYPGQLLRLPTTQAPQ